MQFNYFQAISKDIHLLKLFKVYQKHIACIIIIWAVSLKCYSQKSDSLLIKELHQLPNDTTKARFLISKSDELVFTDPVKSNELLVKAYEILKSESNLELWAEINQKLGNQNYERGNYEKAHQYLMIALEIYESKNNERGIIQCYDALSLLFVSQGDFENAINYNNEILKIHKQNNDEKGIAASTNHIGITYFIMEDYQQAEKYYEEALKMFSNLNDTFGQAKCYNNLGIIYKRTNRVNKAIYQYEKAAGLFKEVKEFKAASYALSNIGGIYMEQKDFKKAERYLNEALAIKRELKNEIEVSQMLKNLGDLYMEMGLFEKSIKYHNDGLAIARKLGSKVEQSQSLQSIAETYAKVNNYKKAYEFHQQYKLMSDSLVNEKSKKAIYNLKISYETEKKEQQISFLSKQNRNQKITNIIISIALVLSFLTMLLLYSRFKMRKKVLKAKKYQAEAELEEQKAVQKQQELQSKLRLEEEQRKQEELKTQAELTLLNNEKLQAELDYSHRELSSTTMYAYQKNEILNKINEIIVQLTPENKETKEKVKELKGIVKNNLDDENDWERLKLHFEKVHPDFFCSLHEKHPSLTQHELKHCAYLKIKLSNKEIAALLNVSPKSMQMARYRLKKKMDLGPDEDLIEFINII